MKTRRLDLQEIRVKHKLTQQKIAEVTDYPQSFISQIERGKVSVPQLFIDKLRTLFNIEDVDDYVTYIEVKKVPTETAEPAEAEQPKEEQPASSGDAQEAFPTADQITISRLVELLNKSERRNEKLEAEIERLKAELSTPK